VHGAADDPPWSARDAAGIRLADELHDTAEASDPTYAELERHFTAPESLELVVTAGWYHTISFVINTAGVQVEPWAARFSRSSRLPVVLAPDQAVDLDDAGN
jgi:4-carboxymuconolactone decarboxylase